MSPVHPHGPVRPEPAPHGFYRIALPITFAEAARRAFDEAIARAVELGANVLPPGRRWVVPMALLLEPTAGCVSAKTSSPRR